MHLIDIQLMTAMGPPGGGRNDLTPRFIRHFNVISMNEFSDDAMLRIFTSIMEWHIKTQVGGALVLSVTDNDNLVEFNGK